MTTAITTTKEIEVSQQVEVIDSYIELGYSYEEAYQMWEDDYNRRILVIGEEEETKEPGIKIEYTETSEERATIFQAIATSALNRGFSYSEAAMIASNTISLRDSGNYKKAYNLYLVRLFV